MKYFAIFSFLCLGLAAKVQAQGRIKPDPCQMFGSVYIEEKHRTLASHHVYLEEAEELADLNVFKVESHLFADHTGHWYITKNREEADFVIFIEKNKGLADFSIHYTKTESFAGCKH
jgi:hypothetical protein